MQPTIPGRQAARGFSLIEIMIVLAVMAVVGGIAVYAIGVVRDRVRIAQAEQDLQILYAAIEQLSRDTGQFPYHISRNNRLTGSPVETWDLSRPYAGLLSTDGNFPRWKGPYLDRIPVDPWGRNYFFDPDYWPNNTGQVCAVVGSFGPTRPTTHDFGSDNIYIKIRNL
jgi:general secretion pathway protein G